MTTLQATVSFTIIDCATCSIPFGITSELEERRRKDHGGFHCPNGHSNVFRGPSALQQERDQAKAEADRARRALAIAERQRDEAKAAATAAKGLATKARNELQRQAKRSAAGVCPCCTRSFVQLARHMKTQHPEHVR